MNAPDLARFLAPTHAEQAAAATEDLEQRFAREAAEHVSYTAMCAGAPGLVIDRTHNGDTLADMLSEHTCNYRVDIDAPNPADLLCTMLAEALRSTDKRVQVAAEAYAKRIQADYVLCREKVAA